MFPVILEVLMGRADLGLHWPLGPQEVPGDPSTGGESHEIRFKLLNRQISVRTHWWSWFPFLSGDEICIHTCHDVSGFSLETNEQQNSTSGVPSTRPWNQMNPQSKVQLKNRLTLSPLWPFGPVRPGRPCHTDTFLERIIRHLKRFWIISMHIIIYVFQKYVDFLQEKTKKKMTETKELDKGQNWLTQQNPRRFPQSFRSYHITRGAWRTLKQTTLLHSRTWMKSTFMSLCVCLFWM